MRKPVLHRILLAIFASCMPAFAGAAELNGAGLGVVWGVPFAGLLLSIALLPLLMPQLWHRHYGKIALCWALAFLLPCGYFFGMTAAMHGAAHALLAEFLPFIILIATLFTVAGGICLRGNLHGTPALNTGLLALGTVLASIMGTTGAAMLLIRPLIRANDNRKDARHVIVFFIFLVANAGGALTPLGDPPLFLGFLKGVDFFWTMRHILPETLFLCGTLLVIFYLLDRYRYRREGGLPPLPDPTPDTVLRIEGKCNFILLAAVVGMVLVSGLWHPDAGITLLGTRLELQNVVRDVALVGVMVLSLWLTPREARQGNAFSWKPVKEVAKLFAAIFITIVPVIAMLRAGAAGSFAPVIHAVTDASGEPVNTTYFWATGILSAFLDNAPTYLVFFNTAGGDAHVLMTTFAPTLAAISCGAVFMGAASYIGNAPNLMVKAIAEEQGIRMPSFFGYLGWSCAVLAPLFIGMTFLFFN